MRVEEGNVPVGSVLAGMTFRRIDVGDPALYEGVEVGVPEMQAAVPAGHRAVFNVTTGLLTTLAADEVVSLREYMAVPVS